MAKPTEEKQAEPKNKLKVHVVSLGDYFTKARKAIDSGEADINSDVWSLAVQLLYSENEVIAILDKKGEQRFVCRQ